MGFFDKYPYTNFHEMNLDWIINNIKNIIEEIENLSDWKASHEAEYEELKKMSEDIAAGNFPESMYDAMRKWWDKNAVDLVGKLVKHVFFGLTDDGYFVAYIPESWDDIIFNTTGLDILIPDVDYGTLVLSY